MLLMMFAVHCTWVTSNAYSSPSIVLAFYNGNDGWAIFSLTRRWGWGCKIFCLWRVNMSHSCHSWVNQTYYSLPSNWRFRRYFNDFDRAQPVFGLKGYYFIPLIKIETCNEIDSSGIDSGFVTWYTNNALKKRPACILQIPSYTLTMIKIKFYNTNCLWNLGTILAISF